MPCLAPFCTHAPQDIVLPAFTDKRHYISDVASGCVAAAVMARVPILVDADELAAYSYLEYPAYILRQEGDDEIQSIAKLRDNRINSSTDLLNITAAWEVYEQKLYKQNHHALQRALQIPSTSGVTA